MLPNAPQQPDRRQIQRQSRIPYPIGFITEAGEVVATYLQDLSIQGIGLLTDRYLDTGTLLNLSDQGAAHDPATRLTTEVKHATRLSDGRWLIGCAFSRLLNVDDAMRLG